jgi:glutamate synthase domain-containing protein 2/glutamate synthase domain-containing protein 1/glutamate synthase domain-containing protein 3
MTFRPTSAGPAAGLYHPAHEHDACGVAFVARLHAGPSHEVVARGLHALDNMEHRGAAGADAETGDGAGIMLDLPDAFLRAEVPFALPAPGRYGVAMAFLPREAEARAELEAAMEQVVRDEGQAVLGWRDVPVDPAHAGAVAREAAPVIRQLFIGLAADVDGEAAAERRLYVIRRQVEARAPGVAIPSCSARSLVYKGMLNAPQLPGYFPDLRDPRLRSRFALVHSRFSTNTFPSWELAHPYRVLAHNGEINTLRGNVNWMRAREAELRSELFGDDLEKVKPVIRPGLSDSAALDAVVELLLLAGRSLPHVMMMLIPEAPEGRDLPASVKGFYDYHACLVEPWDGPAAVAFTDTHLIGATLDRNGLRPGRWAVTRDGWVVMASEAGVLPLDQSTVERKGRLQPGKLFLVDLDAGRVLEDHDVKREVAARRPYGAWFHEHVVHFEDLPAAAPRVPRTEPLRARQLAFGWTQEDVRVLLQPMALKGEEPLGSMGNDLSLAVLSDRQPSLFSYFKQLFAQVTNPPIDPIRERIVMSLQSAVGPELNLLDETPEHAHVLSMTQPILRNAELEKLRQVPPDVFRAHAIDITWPVQEGEEGLAAALERIQAEASAAVADGITILILSDRNLGSTLAPIPSLLAVSSVHHHLVREGTRLRCGLVIESGEPREVHHVATLIGYGASAVNPYLIFETLAELHRDGRLPGIETLDEAEERMVKALGKGLLKVMSKMGISTVESYCGAQIFEAVGLAEGLVHVHFTGTPSRIGGVGLDVLAREALLRHRRGYPPKAAPELPAPLLLPSGGVYAWRRDGEHHVWNPETIAALQHAVRAVDGDGRDAFRRFCAAVDDDAARKSTLRGLLRLREDAEPVPLSEVEPATEIVRRFSTGAMSLGAISPESHEALAIAMNRIGGRSNTGEGGEDRRRYTRDPNGDDRRSAIKQVASGRFGVTIDYLVNADALQIKMAQGAKPGEGGQLPGHKVDEYIGKLRHSTPGVGLISPPPHHDIYSIEDLKQLIYDLRCANPRARVSVKLVSEVGVGTVAAGVVKANADHITIAGHDGGTGASPLSSIQAAGVPWEIGLAETQQTLMRNDLRSRVVLEADGQMKTGRDVVVAALLGADEVGFSTAPLITMGCIMMRVCHLNTCPVGIATQDPVLRAKFAGTPDQVVRYLFLVAEEVRELMASLGVRRFEELIGRTDLLRVDDALAHWKARGVDLSGLLAPVEGGPRHHVRAQRRVLDDALDHALIEAARPALEGGGPVRLRLAVRNVNRCVGGLLSSEIARRHGPEGLPGGSIVVDLEGSAGQSFGAWLAPGVELTLRGEANDYVGKGLSGGLVAVRPADDAGFPAEESSIVGNTVLYGATSGRAFLRGRAGERFAVRNSGAAAVVEGVGDHGCEYMTGGHVVVLGETGRNFAAGMSGGVAYVHDPRGLLPGRLNRELVDLDELDEADRIELRLLIEEHRERTGSTVAAALLGRWDEALGEFAKVMPRDFKRVLQERAARELAAAPTPQGLT